MYMKDPGGTGGYPELDPPSGGYALDPGKGI